ncbi:hypothetical protein GLAREA_05693 [Glarea lozoyensis ATCC 20868]|uniref:Uncharacterized protein n=1 Tax=Glarea lozoyensis (strain ATCC 20868 / MF5171) TaxID=1116229 RepID=S3DF37_GLAL2|nr:uncharacterized protein GLAREA_05693 [Glarea lozoyensis ATCC 20868]EPE36355.1 hypothetical protein GLAREA_05693 [Glarea lozoyensis ATCC 20868]
MPSKSRRQPTKPAKPQPNQKKMTPGLTLDTTTPAPPSLLQQPSTAVTSHTPSPLRQQSPLERPPVSPLTPTKEKESPSAQPPRQTYTHPTQQPQVAIPLPPLEPIVFEDNPDVIALKSTIAILQIQARNATADIRTLKKVKERAVQNPKEFTDALVNGELGGQGPSVPMYHDYDSEDSEDEKPEGGEEGNRKWPTLPKAQNVVRCPPINWTQYAVAGESLDKLHNDQVARPNEGMPRKTGANGELVFQGDGLKRATDFGIAAPYSPLTDRLDKKPKKK